ncbi:MAG: S8 family serine peptidase [Bacteroidota bacterium]|jgi:subtilisin family serine protease|nr:S8 family peptidase [Cytophagales bacterium]MCE2956417.1 S8 family peptidase [Flammeovirgaceae bacterium]
MKKLLPLIILLLSLNTHLKAQRDPSKEILIFFKEGANREAKQENGETILRPTIKKQRLKSSLAKLGINEINLEVANPKFNEADTIKAMKDNTYLQLPNMAKLFRFRVPDDKSKKDLIEALNKLPEVLYAEANGSVAPLLIPSDTRFNQQWGLRNTTTIGADIHAEAAWDIYTGNANNIIGIIDGGVDATHVDLNDKISGGDTGFGWSGHGIHVAGIAAAESNNSQGVSGVDWNARIHAQRIDNTSDDVDTFNAIVDAVDFSPNLFVINNSWSLVDENRIPKNSLTVRQAFAYAYKSNRTSVVSMGNSHVVGQPTDGTEFPAGFDNVIAVGASDISDRVANFSNRGNHIDVTAPGVNIMSTFTNGGYTNQSGTSMASPHVAGVASLLKGFNPSLANDDIENIIRLSADDLNNPGLNDGTGPGFDQSSGAGRVNAERALNFLRAPFSLDKLSATGGTVSSSTGFFTQQFLAASNIADGNYVVKRHEVRRQITFSKSYCDIPNVWGVGFNARGWSLANPNFGEGFTEVVPGTVTQTGATLRTFVYEVTTIGGTALGFFPATPSNVIFSYTVHGIAPTLNGSNLICATANYSVANQPIVSSITWSSSNPSGLSINPTTGVATRVNNYNGPATITATINGGCGGVNLQRNVWVGNPPADNSTLIWTGVRGTNPVTLNTGSTNQYQCDFVPYADSYTWVLPRGFRAIGSTTTSSPFISITTTSQVGTYTLLCRANNGACFSWTSSLTINVVSSGGGGQQMRAAFPNPANDSFTVKVKEEDSKEVAEVALFNKSMERVYYVKTEEKEVIVSTTNLLPGVYYLNVVLGKEVTQKQVVINH